MEHSAFENCGKCSRNIETLEDFVLFMDLVYRMNPDKTEEEIDDIIMNGVSREGKTA